MYLDYFGLEKTPFKITPDPDLFFTGGNRGASLEALLFAVNRGEGITKVVGEVGSGKTMLCRMVANSLEQTADVVYLAYPSIGPKNVLHVIAKELAIDIEFHTHKVEVLQLITQYLVDRHTQGRRVVLLVEEAQSMPQETLEEIRLLSNLETGEDKLLQIILFGQPELDHNLKDVSIRQLKERIATSLYLRDFESDDIHEYLNHRMHSAGYRGPEVFSESVAAAMLKPSQGLIRRLNILADKALMVVYAKQRRAVKVDDIRRAMGESTFSQSWPIEPQKILAAVFAVTLILAFVVGNRMRSEVVGSSVVAVNSQIEAYPPESIIENGQAEPFRGADVVDVKVANDVRGDSD
ncbi:MAG: AAA family ATPase [Pseudomonadales bacterium]|nr:AAA family ATPase [Pseudomonadales bacterium]